MRPGVAVALVLGLCSIAVGQGRKSTAPTVTLDFDRAVALEDVLKMIAETGKINIVAVDLGVPPAPIKVKRVPWDTALDDLVTSAKLAYQRTGNLIIVGKPEMIAARKKAAKRKYKGKLIDLDVVNAEAPAAAKLLATASGAGIAIDGKGPRAAHLRLKKVPSDQAAELLALTTGTKFVARTSQVPAAPSATCIADTTQMKQLRLAGIARSGTKGWALFIDPTGGSYVATKGNCIGVGATMVLGFGAGTVSLDLGDSDSSAVLRPRP